MNKRKTVWLFSTVFMLGLLIILKAKGLEINSSQRNVKASTELALKKEPEATQSIEPPQLLVLVTTPYGFEPEEVKINPGKTLVIIKNRSGAEQLIFKISGAQQGISTLEGEARTDISTELVFSEGKAVIAEENHPEWTCEIEIEERQ